MSLEYLRVLLIEDNLAEAQLLEEWLQDEGFFRCQLHHVTRLQAGLAFLAQTEVDAVLLDLSLPDSQGLESMVKIADAQPALAVVVMTHTNDQDLAIQSLRLGAQDYLVKNHDNAGILLRAIAYAVERKRIQQELLKLNTQLQQEIQERNRIQGQLEHSNAELERFAYVVSHDLRQPLSTIQGWAQLLYRTSLDDRGQRYVETILRGVDDMNHLIEDLLTYSRVGRQEVQPCATDLTEIFQIARARLEGAIAAANVTVTWDPLPVVYGEPQRLLQLLQNLLDNSIKYGATDRPAEIHLSSYVDGTMGEDVIAIRDNGIGIAPEDQDRVFGLFQRLHQVENQPGTGLGLAICQKIVQHHGGRIWLESVPDQGTTFYFSLPKQPKGDPAAE